MFALSVSSYKCLPIQLLLTVLYRTFFSSLYFFPATVTLCSLPSNNLDVVWMKFVGFQHDAMHMFIEGNVCMFHRQTLQQQNSHLLKFYCFSFSLPSHPSLHSPAALSQGPNGASGCTRLNNGPFV